MIKVLNLHLKIVNDKISTCANDRITGRNQGQGDWCSACFHRLPSWEQTPLWRWMLLWRTFQELTVYRKKKTTTVNLEKLFPSLSPPYYGITWLDVCTQPPHVLLWKSGGSHISLSFWSVWREFGTKRTMFSHASLKVSQKFSNPAFPRHPSENRTQIAFCFPGLHCPTL